MIISFEIILCTVVTSVPDYRKTEDAYLFRREGFSCTIISNIISIPPKPVLSLRFFNSNRSACLFLTPLSLSDCLHSGLMLKYSVDNQPELACAERP